MPTLLEIFKDELKDVPNVRNKPKMKTIIKTRDFRIPVLLALGGRYAGFV